jgi:hypothetical protein
MSFILEIKSSFIRLHQLPIDKDAIPLRPHSREKEFPPLLNGDLMLLVDAHHQFIPLCEFERGDAEVFDDRLAIDFDFQIADELIERKIHAMLFVNTDREAEDHSL